MADEYDELDLFLPHHERQPSKSAPLKRVDTHPVVGPKPRRSSRPTRSRTSIGAPQELTKKRKVAPKVDVTQEKAVKKQKSENEKGAAIKVCLTILSGAYGLAERVP
jgi:SWI/SNF-related matrix-associated actin-dependent regulator of chromatin subfamily A member 5